MVNACRDHPVAARIVLEGQLPEGFASGRDLRGAVVLEYFGEVVFEDESAAFVLHDLAALVAGDGVGLLDRQFGIGAQLRGVQLAVEVVGVAARREGDAGAQRLGGGAVGAQHGARDALTGPRHQPCGLFEVGEQLFPDHVAVRPPGVEAFVRKRVEAGRNVAPDAHQFVVNPGAQEKRLAQQVGHVGVMLRIAVGAQSSDAVVGPLDGDHGIGEGVAEIVVRLAVFVDGVGRMAVVLGRRHARRGTQMPFGVVVVAVIGPQTAVERVEVDRLVDAHHGTCGERGVGEDRLVGERGLGLRLQEVVQTGAQADGCGEEYDGFQRFHL